MTKRSYGYLEFKFKTDKAAWRCYEFLSFGKAMDLIPRIEIQLDGKTLAIGWWQPK